MRAEAQHERLTESEHQANLDHADRHARLVEEFSDECESGRADWNEVVGHIEDPYEILSEIAAIAFSADDPVEQVALIKEEIRRTMITPYAECRADVEPDDTDETSS